MEFEPKKAQGPVVKPGEFAFSAAGLDHGHIVGMCAALIEAGADVLVAGSAVFRAADRSEAVRLIRGE